MQAPSPADGRSLQRLRNDLATVEQAAGVGLRFSRHDMYGALAMSVCGLAGAIVAAVVSPENYRLAAPCFFLMIPIVLWTAKANRGKRATQPHLWREAKLGLWVAGIVAPAAMLYIYWERSIGMPREMTGAAAVFFCGLATLLLGLFDRTRRPCIAAGLPLMAFGLAIPFCTPREVVIVGGICVMAAGLGQAAVMSYQLKAAEHAESAD